MLVRLFWRDCVYRDREWGATPVDCFWVEATKREAEWVIFPRLSSSARDLSKSLAQRHSHMAAMMGSPDHPYCYLVARDLSSIDSFQPHYPIANLWNGYSPFRSMPLMEITTLEELQTISLTPDNSFEE